MVGSFEKNVSSGFLSGNSNDYDLDYLHRPGHETTNSWSVRLRIIRYNRPIDPWTRTETRIPILLSLVSAHDGFDTFAFLQSRPALNQNATICLTSLNVTRVRRIDNFVSIWVNGICDVWSRRIKIVEIG